MNFSLTFKRFTAGRLPHTEHSKGLHPTANLAKPGFKTVTGDTPRNFAGVLYNNNYYYTTTTVDMQFGCGLMVGSEMLYNLKPSGTLLLQLGWGFVRVAVKRIEMLKRLYRAVLEGKTEFSWGDFFVLLAPVASHTYIQNTLYNLLGRGVLVKQDGKYVVVVDRLEELLREYNAI